MTNILLEIETNVSSLFVISEIIGDLNSMITTDISNKSIKIAVRNVSIPCRSFFLTYSGITIVDIPAATKLKTKVTMLLAK